MKKVKPFLVTAAAGLVAAVIGIGVGTLAVRFTIEDLFEVDITPEGENE